MRDPSPRARPPRRSGRLSPAVLVVALCVAVIAVILAGIAVAGDMDDKAGTVGVDAVQESSTDEAETGGAGNAERIDLGIDGKNPITGEPVKLANFHGRPVVLVVWASWCAVCNEEAPLIRDVAARTPDVQFVGIDIADDGAGAQGFYDRHGWTFPSIDDPLRERMARVGVPGQPSFIFVNANGAIVARVIGAASAGQLQQGMAAARR